MTVADPDATHQPLIGLLTVAARSLSRELDGSHRPVHLSVADGGSQAGILGTRVRPVLLLLGVAERAVMGVMGWSNTATR